MIAPARDSRDHPTIGATFKRTHRRPTARGWIVPAYTLPPDAQHITVLRMVVKENFSRDMVDMLAHDVGLSMHALARGTSVHPRRPRTRPTC